MFKNFRLSQAAVNGLKLFAVAVFTLLASGCQQKVTGILNPKGIISYEQRILLFDSIALMLIVVIPVIIMSFAFIYRYHKSHKDGQYQPNFNHSVLLESIWWSVPCVIIVILGVMSWKYTHKLDPYRKIDGSPVSLEVQVVALPWKWLFIYPKQGIATVNYLKLPRDKQVKFYLTSDNVPMSAFFIPQLGSQIYTMAGMQTKLHLMAGENGTYRGLNAQYNGAGFSDMHFPVTVVDDKELQAWFASIKQTGGSLDLANYEKLRMPTEKSPATFYNQVEPNLFHTVLMSYMKTPNGNMSDLRAKQ